MSGLGRFAPSPLHRRETPNKRFLDTERDQPHITMWVPAAEIVRRPTAFWGRRGTSRVLPPSRGPLAREGAGHLSISPGHQGPNERFCGAPSSSAAPKPVRPRSPALPTGHAPGGEGSPPWGPRSACPRRPVCPMHSVYHSLALCQGLCVPQPCRAPVPLPSPHVPRACTRGQCAHHSTPLHTQCLPLPVHSPLCHNGGGLDTERDACHTVCMLIPLALISAIPVVLAVLAGLGVVYH